MRTCCVYGNEQTRREKFPPARNFFLVYFSPRKIKVFNEREKLLWDRTPSHCKESPRNLMKVMVRMRIMRQTSIEALCWRPRESTRLDKPRIGKSLPELSVDGGGKFATKFNYASMTFVVNIYRVLCSFSETQFAASTAQYAHYVFNAIDRDANGSVSFEVIFAEKLNQT